MHRPKVPLSVLPKMKTKMLHVTYWFSPLLNLRQQQRRKQKPDSCNQLCAIFAFPPVYPVSPFTGIPQVNLWNHFCSAVILSVSCCLVNRLSKNDTVSQFAFYNCVCGCLPKCNDFLFYNGHASRFMVTRGRFNVNAHLSVNASYNLGNQSKNWQVRCHQVKNLL